MKFRFGLLIVCLGLSSCGGNNQNSQYFSLLEDADLSDISAYESNSPYSAVLAECTDINSKNDSCRLDTLPIIGQETETATLADIKNRLVVSHLWMAERFMQALAYLPSEALQLFKSVTAIVIDADIGTSFYLMDSGAIYLNPQRLWLTNEEKQTITPKEDFRSDYGDELSILFFSRHVINGAYAYRYYSLDDDKERTLTEIIFPLNSTVIHELAHANDFIPVNKIPSLNPKQTIAEAIDTIEENWISNILYRDMPLLSSELTDLAEVRYRGATATPTQTSMTADYAGALFHNDGANHLYNYSSRREDLADLIQAILVKRYFNIEMDIAFIDKPENSQSTSCADYIVGWGERNRIANPLVINRAQFAAESMLPNIDWETFFQQEVGQYTAMIAGNSWCDNLALTRTKALRNITDSASPKTINPSDFIKPH